MIRNIKNLEQLRQERFRIQTEIESTTLLIKNDIHEIKSNFNPLKVVLGFAKTLLFNQNNGLMNDSIRTVVGNFAYRSLLPFLPFPFRVAATYMLKNAVSNYVYEKKDTIAEKVMSIIGNLSNLFKKKDRPASTQMLG